MKILIASGQWFPDFTGGTARVARATAEGLVRNGHDVVAVVPRTARQPDVSSLNGVEVRRVLRRSALPLSVTDIYEVRRAIRQMQADRFDLILAHGDMCAAGALAARPRLPIALAFHASGCRETRYRRSLGLRGVEQGRSLILEPVLRRLERFAVRHADRVLVLSEFSRSLVLDSHHSVEDRIEVVGGGVDTTVFTPALDRGALRQRLGIALDQPILMTARRLVKRMGLEMLLDAFGQLHRRGERLQLVIAGEGELRARLEAQRDTLGLNGSVRFLGRISDQDLRDWYRASDLFVLPTIAYEGFGMVTAEALACGTPVVGTQVGATSEILAGLDANLLAEHPDARSLVSAIERTLRRLDAPFRVRCREYARSRLSWSQAIIRWEAALTDALAGPVKDRRE